MVLRTSSCGYSACPIHREYTCRVSVAPDGRENGLFTACISALYKFRALNTFRLHASYFQGARLRGLYPHPTPTLQFHTTVDSNAYPSDKKFRYQMLKST